MTRDLSALNIAEAEASVLLPVIFVKLEFDDGNINIHSRIGDITWGGDTYSGVGNFGSLTPTEEDTELGRTNMRLQLSGIPTAYISALLNQQYQGRAAKIYLGFLNQSTRALVDTPHLLRQGFMDSANITRGKEATITIQVENEIATWDRANVRRYNGVDQKMRYASDKGLDFVEQMVEKVIVWGANS